MKLALSFCTTWLNNQCQTLWKMIIDGGVEGGSLCSVTFTFNRIGDGAGADGGISTTGILKRNGVIMNKNHL